VYVVPALTFPNATQGKTIDEPPKVVASVRNGSVFSAEIPVSVNSVGPLTLFEFICSVQVSVTPSDNDGVNVIPITALWLGIRTKPSMGIGMVKSPGLPFVTVSVIAGVLKTRFELPTLVIKNVLESAVLTGNGPKLSEFPCAKGVICIAAGISSPPRVACKLANP
jgi:hypothetical protein